MTQQQKLTNEQIEDAVKQLRTHCALEMEKPARDWQYMCVRGILHDLGYHGEDTVQIMDAIYDHGFTYCFDPDYQHANSDTYPSADSCYWMPDQLSSRLPGWLYKLAQ